MPPSPRAVQLAANRALNEGPKLGEAIGGFLSNVGKDFARGARKTPLLSAGMWAAGGAIAGAGGDVAFNNGNDVAASAIKGALIGGIGRFAAGGVGRTYRGSATGIRNIEKAWTKGGGTAGRFADAKAAVANAMPAAGAATDAPILKATAGEAFSGKYNPAKRFEGMKDIPLTSTAWESPAIAPSPAARTPNGTYMRNPNYREPSTMATHSHDFRPPSNEMRNQQIQQTVTNISTPHNHSALPSRYQVKPTTSTSMSGASTFRSYGAGALPSGYRGR